MKYLVSIFLLICSISAFAKHPISIHFVKEESKASIPGVTVHIPSVNKIFSADSTGKLTLPDLPAGKYKLECTAVGFREKELTISLPATEPAITISLDAAYTAMEDVIVSSTRTNQLLKNTSITVQVIDREDIDEGTAQSPSNIRELLTELSGTQVQTTSAVSGNTSIRLQGLDGRYTQLLKDGFPLYGGFSGGLSILQVPPLDLHQVEVIKGAGSALYGSDAIAGIINLISRRPDSSTHLDAILNQTNRQGTDLGAFYSSRNKHTGITVMGSASRQNPFDVNKDGFSDLPKIRQATLAPSFFWYPDDSTTIRFGINVSAEDRTGGDMEAIAHGIDNTHPFLQQNHTDRDYYQLSYTHKAANHQTLSLKNSIGYFNRHISQSSGDTDTTNPTIMYTGFSGVEWSSFTEASYSIATGAHQLVAGSTLTTDHFKPDQPHQDLGYTHNTVGIFAQDDWAINKQITVEAGARGDLHRTLYFLPRLAMLYKPMPHLDIRWGAGLAYKLPTVFNATDEEEAYQQVYPIAPDIHAERSASTNLAISYKTPLGDDLFLSVDESIYYTRLQHALIARTDSLQKGWLYYINAPAQVSSYGSETNMRLTMDDLTLQLGYTYTKARRLYLPGSPQLPLTPEHRLSASLVYEAEPNWKAGVEGFYNGPQTLDNGQPVRDYWTFDAMVQRSIGPWAILLNLENITDCRQSRFGALFTGTRQHPVFNEVYAPLEGSVVSLAVLYHFPNRQ